jgi:hypothetical protein
MYELQAAAGELARKAIRDHEAGPDALKVATDAAMNVLKNEDSLDPAVLQKAYAAAHSKINDMMFSKPSVASSAARFGGVAAYTAKLGGKNRPDFAAAESVAAKLLAMGGSDKTIAAACEGLACIIKDHA